MINLKNWPSFVNGREIVIWGTGEFAWDTLQSVREENLDVEFFVSKEWASKPVFLGKKVCAKETLDKKNHYVIIGSSIYRSQIKLELEQIGYAADTDFAWIQTTLSREDHRVNGVFVGKYSSAPLSWRCLMVDKAFGWQMYKKDFVSSIGRFTLINNTAALVEDHMLKTLSVNEGSFSLLNAETRKNLDKKYENLFPQHHRIKIGNDVWIGANTVINISRVKEISDGAIIAAGAIVTQDVPPYAVIGGVPGKIIKCRYTQPQIECLLRVKWWDWSDDEFNENAETLYNTELFFEKFL